MFSTFCCPSEDTSGRESGILTPYDKQPIALSFQSNVHQCFAEQEIVSTVSQNSLTEEYDEGRRSTVSRSSFIFCVSVHVTETKYHEYYEFILFTCSINYRTQITM